jgi:hypothetical protein
MIPSMWTMPSGDKGLFLSSSGGHFAELQYIAEVFHASEESSMITFDGLDTKNVKSKYKTYYFMLTE